MLDQDELRRVIVAAPTAEARAVLLLTYDLALRCGEVCKVRGDQIDFARGVSRVPRLKAGKVHDLQLAPATVDALRPLVIGPDLIFPAWSADRVRQTYRSVAAAAGVDVRPATEGGKGYSHILRRSRAIHLQDDGAPLVEIQWRLGHRSPKTTQIYLNTLTARGRAAADRRAVAAVQGIVA